LLDNRQVSDFLRRHHLEILDEFETIVQTVSLEG
jgi:hypothetical protein